MLGKRESKSKLELYNIYAGYEESKPVLKDISFFVEKIDLDTAIDQMQNAAEDAAKNVPKT